MYVRIVVALGLLVACNRLSTTNDENVDALPQFALVEETRIGDVNDPDIGFSRIGGVDVDRDGNVFVLEAAVPEIRVYGRDGALARRIGRRGGGPGEFERPPRFGVLGDTVWAVEHGGVARLTLFDRLGNVLATGRTQGLKVQLPTSSGYLQPWFMRPDGRFSSHFAMVMSRRDDPPSGVQPTDSIPWPHVLFDVNGEVTDTLGWADRPPPRMWRPPQQGERRLEPIEVGGRRLYAPMAPTATPVWEPLRDGYVVVETPLAETDGEGIINVSRVDVARDTVFRTELRYRPSRWTPEELDSIAGRAARGEPGGMAPMVVRAGEGGPSVPENWEAIASRLRDAMEFPEFKLPIETVWVAPDESIWLRRSGERDAPSIWILLDERGRPRGQIELPARTRMLWSRDDVIWAAIPDENDVQWLVRFRIRAE